MGYNIAMVSDFFYPQPGGVEYHIYHLSQKLINMGHTVVIITHDYTSRNGVRTLTNGLKVYYVPFAIFFLSCTAPTLFLAFPIFRNIFIRELIEIVHAHGSYSNFCHEALLHGRTMGLKTIFTDHSLFGFADIKALMGNKVLKFSLTDIGHIICVSHTCKENTVIRASIDPLDVSVIPNAVVTDDFKPLDPDAKKGKDHITIVVISRLFPNKGADLLTAIIPRICNERQDVEFLVAGDGPRFLELEQMREKYFLQERVKLIGAIKHEDVRDIMVQGEICLHPSLTEAFGTVIVEAAACGLYVVTTNVGGIPEVLPNHMITFAEPKEDSLVHATLEAIKLVKAGNVNALSFHNEIKNMYSWENVARRTENVYDSIDMSKLNVPLFERLRKYYCCGPFAGKLFALCAIVDIFIYMILEWLYPAEHIDKVNKWPRKRRELH